MLYVRTMEDCTNLRSRSICYGSERGHQDLYWWDSFLASKISRFPMQMVPDRTQNYNSLNLLHKILCISHPLVRHELVTHFEFRNLLKESKQCTVHGQDTCNCNKSNLSDRRRDWETFKSEAHGSDFAIEDRSLLAIGDSGTHNGMTDTKTHTGSTSDSRK